MVLFQFSTIVDTKIISGACKAARNKVPWFQLDQKITITDPGSVSIKSIGSPWLNPG